MDTRKPLIALAAILAVAFLPSCLAQFSVGPGWSFPNTSITPTPTPSTFITPTPTPFASTSPTSDVTANPTTQPATANPTIQPVTNPTGQPTPTAPELSIFALIGVMSLLACGVLVAKTRRHKSES